MTAADDGINRGTTTAGDAGAAEVTEMLLLFLARLLLLLLRVVGVLRVPGRIATAGVMARVTANSRRQTCATCRENTCQRD